MKIAAHMWLGPYLPRIPRPAKPVRPTGFLKSINRLVYLCNQAVITNYVLGRYLCTDVKQLFIKFSLVSSNNNKFIALEMSK